MRGGEQGAGPTVSNVRGLACSGTVEIYKIMAAATADNWLATRGGRRCLPPCYPAQAPEVCTNCTNYRVGLISRYFVSTPMAKRGGRRCLPPCSHAHAPEVCTNCPHYRLSSHTKLIILDVMQLNSIQAHNTRLRFDTRLAVLRCNPRPRF